MRRLVVAAIVAAAALLPSAARAQLGSVEITPTVGYLHGGDITVSDRAFKNRDVKVPLAAKGSYGVRVGVGLSKALQLELLAERQPGQLKDDAGLFGEQPGGPVPILSTKILDFDVTYFHLGLVWELTPAPARWYLAAAVGDARLQPSSPLESVDRFSESAAGGVKVELNEHSGLRFEVRFYRTDTSKLRSAVQPLNSKDCYQGGPCTYTYRYNPTLEQSELSVGYLLRF